MKKLFSVLFVIALLASLSNTQAQAKFSLGLRGGTNFANLSWDPDISAYSKSSRTGVLFGAAAEIGFNPMFALQIEPTYLAGGCKLSGSTTYGTLKINEDITFKVSYLAIPILFKVKIPVQGPVTPYAFVGPNVFFIMSPKAVDDISGAVSTSTETDLKDNVTSVGFALDFGAGAGYKVDKNVALTLDVRYSLGLTNMLNDTGKKSFGGTDQSIKANGFQVAVGAMYAL
jgi:opacity protein-like surface antigen